MILKDSPSAPKIEAGTYGAVCVRVVDLGTQTSTFNGKKQRKLLLTWEIPEIHFQDDDGKPVPAVISSSYTASLHEKATLRGILKSWRGRDFTADELAGFDTKNVLGAACLLSIVHSDDGQYANVATVMGLPKGMPKPVPTLELINVDLDTFDEAAFDKLSDKLRDKVGLSPEYRALTAVGDDAFRGGAKNDLPERYDVDPDLDQAIPF